jgi:hypothetical protein
LVPHQEKLRIDFEDNYLLIEGLSEDVNKAEQQLSAEITRLDNEYCSEVMHVDPNLHKFIIGRSGSVGLSFFQFLYFNYYFLKLSKQT